MIQQYECYDMYTYKDSSDDRLPTEADITPLNPLEIKLLHSLKIKKLLTQNEFHEEERIKGKPQCQALRFARVGESFVRSLPPTF